tara:strand:- start:26 stop:466 length:441 start_codon:yes stop_codon:yes gene_type:complete
MTKDDSEKYEKTICLMLNELMGFNLKWVGEQNTFYDLQGKTPNNNKCVVEIKVRNKYYKDKMLEKYKYDKLMALPKDVVKLYFVNDPKGYYIYWLNKIDIPEVKSLRCPSTTMWSKDRKDKEVYLLSEHLASVIEKSNINPNDVWY